MERPPLLLPLALLALLWGGERGAVALPAGCKHDGRARGTGRAAGAEGKVVCSSLELAQVLPPDTLPNRTVTLLCSSKCFRPAAHSRIVVHGSFSKISTPGHGTRR
ncbi:G protein-coupled receptor 125 (predicted), isoform CRA_a [Rattus norvegicus]|uniref:G protein-coupled receptor 125 (Predicted), isoform CRA_a n=1 Tax=Rattus norvegicus TaxID=10116 RepID=A6IJJ4_RAT|nr:G protein-coupled receptor 125 (predicted), isoform CRA_a [Rattus norvegicus]